MTALPPIRTALALALTVALFAGTAGCSSDDDGDATDPDPTTSTTDATDTATSEDADTASELAITSDAFDDGAPIPAEYTCDGANTQPAFSVTGTPEEAAGLVLIVDDPDAPGGSFIHWVVWNLEPDATVPEGSLPTDAVEGTNGTSGTAWFGPCPPPGSPHKYEFQLSAVSAQPDVQPGATADEVRAAIADTTVATATLVGTYERT